MPLATYGGLDSAALGFAGGAPPAAALCWTFTSGGRDQHGSAVWAPGHLGYVFSQINPTKVSTGGGYYWIAGAVDSTVAAVVLSFPGVPSATRVDLVPLADGWRGFADEYSPGPVMTPVPPEPSVTVTALDGDGKPVDARHINLDTGVIATS